MSTGRLEPRWPPRSPHEALLSSPTGRQKLQKYNDRTSPSPSPLKRASATPNLREHWRIPNDEMSAGNESEEEDEETLQLQLAALEAKIKLKKLHAKKKKAVGMASSVRSGAREKTQSTGKENKRPPSQESSNVDAPSVFRPKSSTETQILVSPQRKPIATQEARSPGRVLLGIDKGLKGKNISLRRPAGEPSKDDDPFIQAQRSSSQSIASLQRSHGQDDWGQSKKPKTFSERIAETRQQDKEQKHKENLLRRQRSTGFGVQQQEMDTFQSAAEAKSTANKPRQRSDPRAGPVEFSRDEVLKAAAKPNGGSVYRSNTSASIRRSQTHATSTDIWTNPNASSVHVETSKTSSRDSMEQAKSLTPPPKLAEPLSRPSSPEVASFFEPFSSLHLSKRILPHDILTRTFSGKHIFLLPDLLGAVKSPDYLLPDIPEADHVVLAIIASKSNPLKHKGAHKTTSTEKSSVSEAADSEQNENGKYMVLTLTDLKWTVDFFLFSTGYTRFRKLIPGTVVALLNPDIMPPPAGRADTGRFSLKLASSDDTVLEIGTSRDLGWCKSVRKDGKQCDNWIDKRHTEFCEFHVDAVVERTRRGRMEVQGMSAPFAPGGKTVGRTGFFGDKGRGQNGAKGDGFAREGPQYNRGTGSRYFICPSLPGGRSAAQLFDAEGSFDRGGSKEERMRKRRAELEKENEIAKKLGEGGNGAGSEYLRLRQGGEASVRDPAQPEAPDPVDATSLGLLDNRARDVHLSPIKKRKGSALGGDGARKKTRFVTDRGIKEAGRESLGGEIVQQVGDDQDEDGELEVI